MGEACFYHPDRQCLVSCVCVYVCDWCSVLCCMSRWMIGLLIFPLAEHKSPFYPSSLNLSRVKCLCSQLLTALCVCCLFYAFCLCVEQNIPWTFNTKAKWQKTKWQLKNSLAFLVIRTEVCVGACLSIPHAQTLSSLQMETLKQTESKSKKTYRKSRKVTHRKGSAAFMCWWVCMIISFCVWGGERERYEVTVWGFMAWRPV